MRTRFDLALKARRGADRVQPERRRVWIPLYEREDASENVSYVGGGAGLDHPPIARIPMNGGGSTPPLTGADDLVDDDQDDEVESDLLTIAEVKRRLALTLGVLESSIKITVEA